jgi:hypothetical protein
MSRKHLVIAAGALLLATLSADVFAQAPPPLKPCNTPFGWWESPGIQPFFINAKGGAPKTDCDFHLWSWTAFAHWMAKDKNGQPAFLSLPTYDDLKSGDKLRAMIGPRTLVLKPRTAKPRTVSSANQASGGVLVDQNGRAVYYSSHMDPIYFGFTQKYFGPAKYKNAAPTLPYPIGATVFKAAWRIVGANETVTDAFTTTATIDLLESDGKGGVQVSGKTQSGITVALVGIHVVGVIKDHPEFAWGTFEQVNNAPDLPRGTAPNSTQPVSSQNFTFYKAGTAANMCNPNPSPTLTIDPASQVISPVTNVFRQFAYGGATIQVGEPDIRTSNESFQGGIKAHSSLVDAVFSNYRLIGTTWIKPNTLQPGDGNIMFEAIGSIDLMNSTLETFVQNPSAGTAFNNCFGCHTTSGGNGYPGKDINISHIILSVLP